MLVLALLTKNAHAGLLADRWRIEGPTLRHDGTSYFELEYVVSDYIRLPSVQYFVYSGTSCQHESPVADTWKAELISPLLETSAIRSSSQTLKLLLEPNAAEPTVCIRFGLYTNAGGVEVNYRETVLELTMLADDRLHLQMTEEL